MHNKNNRKIWMKKLLFILSVALFSNAWAGGDIQAGKAAVEKFACASCHGADFNSPIDPSYPKLAGQHQDYLVHTLVAYQRGSAVRNGRVNAIMNAQAKMLSAKDIENIAAYLNSLPGSLVVRR
jgi:cytochrome c553